MTITIAGHPLSPGERRVEAVEIGTRPDGTPLGVPLLAVRGAQDGPTLGIITGLHGDEYEGPEAVRLLFDALDPATLRGGIVATPVANVSAYEVFNRASAIDHLDLNRSFPGNPEGFISQRVAPVLLREIVDQASHLVDLHSAGLAYDLLPYVGFNSTPGQLGETSFAMAKAFGIEHLYGSTPFPNVVRLEAVKRNIPAILVEVGGEGRCDPAGINVMLRGLTNLLRQLDMLNGSPEGLPERYTIVQAPESGEYTHVPTGGFIRNRVTLGERVEQGQTLGEIIDVFGRRLAEMIAPVSGMVLSFRTIPVVRVGEWSYSVVHVLREVNDDATMEAAIRRNG